MRFKTHFHNLITCICHSTSCLDSTHLNFLQNYVNGPSEFIEYITSADLLIMFGSYHVWTTLWFIINFSKLFQFFLSSFPFRISINNLFTMPENLEFLRGLPTSSFAEDFWDILSKIGSFAPSEYPLSLPWICLLNIEASEMLIVSSSFSSYLSLMP